MDSLRNEPVNVYGSAGGQGFAGTGFGGGISPMFIPGGFAGGFGSVGGGNLLETILLLSLIGKGGFGHGHDHCDDKNLQPLIAILKQEGNLKEFIANVIEHAQINNTAQFTSLANKLCDMDKDSLKAIFESRIDAMKNKSDIIESIGCKISGVKDDVKDFRFDTIKNFWETNKNVDDKFCHLEHNVDNKFSVLERFIDKRFDNIQEREYKNKIEDLQNRLSSHRNDDQDRELRKIRSELSTVICALSKVPQPTGCTPVITDGCRTC